MLVVEVGGRAFALMAFTVVDGRVAEIDIVNDRVRLAAMGLLDA